MRRLLCANAADVVSHLRRKIVAVLAYGGLWGVAISIATVVVASTVGYWVGSELSAQTIEKPVGRCTRDKVEYYVGKYGMWPVVITRLAPFLSNDAISFVGGLLRMGYFRNIVATLLGTFPLAVLIAFLGEDSERLKTGLWLLSGIGAAAFVLWLIYGQSRPRRGV